jgi:hypothetical protein
MRNTRHLESRGGQEAEIQLRSALVALRKTGESEFIAMGLLGLTEYLLRA